MDFKSLLWLVAILAVGYFVGRKWPNLIPLPAAVANATS